MEKFGERYRNSEEIDSGGMGTVYKCYDVYLNRYIALKTIHKNKDTTPEVKERFAREIKSLKDLNHSNIITIYDSHKDSLYYTMEYIEGKPLTFYIENETSVFTICHFMVEICKAIEYAHSQGIIHRDLKPSNIMIKNENKDIKVMDFGIAKIQNTSTITEGIVGTIQYMAPEQMYTTPEQKNSQKEKYQIDERTDIYALGCIFYELLSEKRPFNGSNVNIMTQKMQSTPKKLTDINQEIPSSLEEICMKCLQREKKLRYYNVVSLREAIENEMNKFTKKFVKKSAIQIKLNNEKTITDTKEVLIINEQNYIVEQKKCHDNFEVYLCYKEKSRKKKIVKIFNQNITFDKNRRRQLSPLFRIKGIAKFFIESQDNRLCIIGEYGDSIQQFLSNIPQNLYITIGLIIEIANIISQAHQKNFIHGNLTVENILIEKNRKILITDFFLNSLLQKNGLILSQGYNKRSDIIALGTILFKSLERNWQEIQINSIPQLSKYKDLQNFIDKVFSEDVDIQFQSIEDFSKCLLEYCKMKKVKEFYDQKLPSYIGGIETVCWEKIDSEKDIPNICSLDLPLIFPIILHLNSTEIWIGTPSINGIVLDNIKDLGIDDVQNLIHTLVTSLEKLNSYGLPCLLEFDNIYFLEDGEWGVQVRDYFFYLPNIVTTEDIKIIIEQVASSSVLEILSEAMDSPFDNISSFTNTLLKQIKNYKIEVLQKEVEPFFLPNPQINDLINLSKKILNKIWEDKSAEAEISILEKIKNNSKFTIEIVKTKEAYNEIQAMQNVIFSWHNQNEQFACLVNKQKSIFSSGNFTKQNENQIICEKNQHKMILIPSGEYFFMNIAQKLEEYYISIFPITNEEFTHFVNDKGYEKQEFWCEEGWCIRKEQNWTYPLYWGNPSFNKSDQPVVGISYYEATAYCNWIGLQLPSMEQWVKAARGGKYLDSNKTKENPLSNRLYPWGEDSPENIAIYYDKNRSRYSPSNCNYSSQNVSPYGCREMAGNIWEFCQNNSNIKKINVLGGSFLANKKYLHIGQNEKVYLKSRLIDCGFRCVLNLDKI